MNRILEISKLINREEKLIIDILFGNKRLDKNSFKKLNFDKLIQISSSHLVIPALFYNIKIKRYLNYIPKEFSDYICEIFELNKNRNTILKKEVSEISKLLQDYKKNHVFLKGAAHIFSDLYDNIGERMIGDIDILCDINQSKEVHNLLKNIGYFPKENMKFFSDSGNLHYPRQINKNKLFAVEIHKRLFKKENILIDFNNNFLSDKIIKQGVYLPDHKSQLIHNIYNYQINDFGSYKLTYSYRSLYDTYKLYKYEKKSFNKIIFDKHVKNYFMIAKLLNLNEITSNEIESCRINKLRFILKYRFKFYNKIENFIINQLIMLNWRPVQVVKFLTDKRYRLYLKKKGSKRFFR